MSSDAVHTVHGKRSRPWSTPPHPSIAGGTATPAASPTHAPAPFLGLLRDVPTVTLLRWLSASVSTASTPQGPSSGSRPALDVFFGTQLGHRGPDAMLTETQRQLQEAESALAPADACLFQLLLAGALGDSPMAASASPLGEVHRSSEAAQPSLMPAPVTSPGTTAMRAEAAHGQVTITAGKPKGILKHLTSPPVGIPAGSSGPARCDEVDASTSLASTSACLVDDRLSLTARLLYVILRTGCIEATPRVTCTDSGGQPGPIREPCLASSCWEPTVPCASKAGDPDDAAFWGSPAPASSVVSSAGLSISPRRATPFTRDASFADPSAHLTADFMPASPAAFARTSRLWLSPTTIALVESSRDVAAMLRWSSALDPVLSATLERCQARGHSLSSWDVSPVPPLLEASSSPIAAFDEASEDEAVRRLFTAKSFSTSGNRSPLTNRVRRASDSVRSPDVAAVSLDATQGSLLTEHHHGGSLLRPQYTDAECAMLYTALHYCSVGVPDPYQLTWRVHGRQGGEAVPETAHTQGGPSAEGATTDEVSQGRRRRQSGKKRSFAEAVPPPWESSSHSPRMALHPQFFADVEAEASALTTSLVGVPSREGPKRAKPEATHVGHTNGGAGVLPPRRLCQRNVAALLSHGCEIGTLFVRLDELCTVASQPGKRGALGSYGVCAVDGLRVVLRLLQRQVSTLMWALPSHVHAQQPSSRPAATSVENPLHGLRFERVLDAYCTLQERVAAPLRVLAATFRVDAGSHWDVADAMAHLSSAELLSTLYRHASTGSDGELAVWQQDALGHAQTSDEEDEEAAEEGDARHRHDRHQRLALADVVHYLFLCALSPLNRFLHCWLTRGECRDPLDDFFIVPSYGATPGSYDVDASPQRLPCFISEETAHVMLQAGLSMRVLRHAAAHLVHSTRFVFTALLREDAMEDGTRGVEDTAAAREDAGALCEAVQQFSSAMTGHLVRGSRGASAPGALPMVNPMTAHGAITHWRLFLAGCDDVLVSALEAGLEGVESDGADDGDAMDKSAASGTSSDAASSAYARQSASRSTAVVASTAAVRLTREALKRRQLGLTHTSDRTAPSVKWRHQPGESAKPAASQPASHITIPMYSDVSGVRGGVGPRAAHASGNALSSAVASSIDMSGGGGVALRGRARSFLSYESGFTTSSTALSSGATSALYGAIKAEHRLHGQASTATHQPGEGGVDGTSRKAWQETYEATLRAHQRAMRLAEWKAERQSMWVDRAKAIRDVVAAVQGMYNQSSEPGNDVDGVVIDGTASAAHGATDQEQEVAAPRCSGLVRPCTSPPPQRQVVVLYPAESRHRRPPTMTVAFRDESSLAVALHEDEEGSHGSGSGTHESPRSEEQPAQVPLTTPASAPLNAVPVEIAVSPVRDDVGKAYSTEGTTLTPPPEGPADGTTAGEGERVVEPSRASSSPSSSPWLSPQAAPAPAVASDAAPSPGSTRDAVGGRNVAAVLASLWVDGENDEAPTAVEATGGSPAKDEGAATADQWDSLGLPQPAAFFVVADINDDEYLEQRTVDGAQQQRRRREKLARCEQAREAMAVWHAEAADAQRRASAIADLPAYHEACQQAVERLFSSEQIAEPRSPRRATTAREIEEGWTVAEEGEGDPVTALTSSFSDGDRFRRTWWRDAPHHDEYTDGASRSHALLSTPPVNDGAVPDGGRRAVAATGAHRVWSSSPASLSLSRTERQLLSQCLPYYRQLSLIMQRYCTHKALQLSLLPPHGLQFQWLSSCLDVCLLQHSPTAVTLTEWWQRQVRVRLEAVDSAHGGREGSSLVAEGELLDELNAVFGSAWERLRAVSGAASSAVHLPTDRTRVRWRLTARGETTASVVPTPAVTQTQGVREEGDATSPSYLATKAGDTSAFVAVTDRLLLFLSRITLEREVKNGVNGSLATSEEESMLSPDASLLADYGDLFSSLLFWKLIDELLAQLYQDGLASQERAVFFLCHTARSLLHTLQQHFWERLEALATHYRARSLGAFGAEALYHSDTLESFRRQHHGFVTECRFSGWLAGPFALCRARLLVLLQTLIAAQSAVRRATQRVFEAHTVPGKQEQRRRLRDRVSQYLREFATTAEELVAELQAVHETCAARARQGGAEAGDVNGDDEGEDEELAFGDSWYNGSDGATGQGNTERDRQQAWRARAQYVAGVQGSLAAVIDTVSGKW